MKHITHIFFDLDHTLWDYDSNAQAVLAAIYEKFYLENKLNCSLQKFILGFFEVNKELWAQYNQHQISRDDIRTSRFITLMDRFGYKNDELAEELSIDFLYNCPRQRKIMPDADIVLSYLHKKYTLSIITNGFDDVQAIKLKSCGLDKYFDHVFTSETIGVRKPAPELFQHALEVTKGEKTLSLMIGDNPITDIGGATNAGITPMLYNPNHKIRSECQLQLSHWSELMKIL